MAKKKHNATKPTFMDLTSAQKAPKTKEGRRVSYNNHFVVKRTKKKRRATTKIGILRH